MEGAPDTTGQLPGSLSGISSDIPRVLLEGAPGAEKEPRDGELGLPSLEREDPGGAWSIFQWPKGLPGLGGTRMWSGRKSGNGFKVGKGRSRWDIGEKFLQGNEGASQHIPNPSHGTGSIPRRCKMWNIFKIFLKYLEKSLKHQQNPRQTQPQPIPRRCKIGNIPKHLEKSPKHQQTPRQTQPQPPVAALPETLEQNSRIPVKPKLRDFLHQEH